MIREENQYSNMPLVVDKHFACPINPPSPNVCEIMGHLISPPTLLLPSSLLPPHRSCLCTITIDFLIFCQNLQIILPFAPCESL